MYLVCTQILDAVSVLFCQYVITGRLLPSGSDKGNEYRLIRGGRLVIGTIGVNYLLVSRNTCNSRTYAYV